MKTMKAYLFIFSAIVSISCPIYAWDQYDQEALDKTTELLKNQSARENSIKGDSVAERVDSHTKDLVGGDTSATNDIYKLAADVFQTLAKESDGDPEKMQQLIQQYQRNPAAFAEKWSPEQKARLKEISKKVKVPSASP